MHHVAVQVWSMEEGWGTGVCKSSSIQPNSLILIEITSLAKRAVIFFKGEFDVFTSSEKGTQLIFIERIRQSQKLTNLPSNPV